jgi:hypothetical protein
MVSVDVVNQFYLLLASFINYTYFYLIASGYWWTFTSFLVLDSGRAYCGKVLNV